jgi:hypothetical protein
MVFCSENEEKVSAYEKNNQDKSFSHIPKTCVFSKDIFLIEKMRLFYIVLALYFCIRENV